MSAVPACLAVTAWAVALSVVDIRSRRLPNVLTVPGALMILMASVVAGRGLPAFIGAAALGALYLVIHLLDPGGMGGGDVKLAVGLGALTGAIGAPVWLIAALGAPVLTVVCGSAMMMCRRDRSTPTVLAHGPSMCLASLAAAALAVF